MPQNDQAANPKDTEKCSEPVFNGAEKSLEVENRKTLTTIASVLQRGASDSIEKSEGLVKQAKKQARWLKNFTVVFAVFFTYLQVRQIYVDNAAGQRESKFSAWEMVHNVQEKDTSAGLAIALTTLAEKCEPLSGLNLSGKYLPEIELAFPSQGTQSKVLSFVGTSVFGVPRQSRCGEQDSNQDEQQNSDQGKRTTLDLRGINFKAAMLQQATFRGTDLTGAVFQEANLQEASFEGKPDTALSLSAANFQRANLLNASLTNVDLQNANFSQANLRGANLSNTENLALAVFEDAVYTNATRFPTGFTPDNYQLLKIAPGENLAEANLGGANLSTADLSEASLEGANLSKANLTATNLANTNLTRANLTGAQLENTNLAGARLTDANLSGVQNLSLAQIQAASDWLTATYDDAFCAKFEQQDEQPTTCQPAETEASE